MKKFPPIPPDYKIIAIYGDRGPDQEQTAIAVSENEVIFYIWDGESPMYNSFYRFNRIV